VTSEPANGKPRGHRDDGRLVHSSAVADFLHRALAGGALSVAELEAKARTAGLLGECQQIQHAKVFKKAKKALGIRSIRNGFGSGGKWAWFMPPQNEIEIRSVANSQVGSQEQRSIRARRPAEPESRCIVQQWIEDVQRLDYVRSPTAVPLIRWHLFLGDCRSFLSSSEKLGRSRCDTWLGR
jgi:hypothetical protein